MQANNQDRITFFGAPRIELKLFHAGAGELTLYCDVEHCTKKYKQLPILKLSMSADYGEVDVNDKYTAFLPYLKASPNCRGFIDYHLQQCVLVGREQLFRKGLDEYLKALRTYDDVKGMMRQAKTCVSHWSRPDDYAETERRARTILAAFGRTPEFDIQVEFRDR
ncbi:MAG: hypothetical protein WAU28_00225 [Candidatus Moraniibacteriota bacterium]